MSIPVTISVNGEPRRIEPDTALDTLVQSLTAAPSGVACSPLGCSAVATGSAGWRPDVRLFGMRLLACRWIKNFRVCVIAFDYWTKLDAERSDESEGSAATADSMRKVLCSVEYRRAVEPCQPVRPEKTGITGRDSPRSP